MKGRVSDFCERPGLIANMEMNDYFKNRWLDFVFQMDMRKGKEITRFWVNERLIGVIKGDLSPQGKFLGFKFLREVKYGPNNVTFIEFCRVRTDNNTNGRGDGS